MLRRRFALLLGLLVNLVALLLAPSWSAAAGSNSAMQALEQGVLADLNAYRHEHGLVALRLSRALTSAAKQHSSEMAFQGYFSHSSANGTSFDHRIGRYYPMGRSRYWSVGENLLWASPDVDATRALQMWINSPEHNANLLAARWREIGISAVHSTSAPGAFAGREVTIVTADFGVRH